MPRRKKATRRRKFRKKQSIKLKEGELIYLVGKPYRVEKVGPRRIIVRRRFEEGVLSPWAESIPVKGLKIRR